MIQLLGSTEIGVGAGRRIGRQVADDAAGEPGEPEQQLKRRRRHAAGREDPVVAVHLAHHAVAEAIGRGRELDRHERRLLEAVELAPVVENLRDDALLGDRARRNRAAPSTGSARSRSAALRRRRRPAASGRSQLVADLVVELQQREVRLRDEQVLVVAMIADQREAFGATRQVVPVVAGDAAGRDVDVLADQELRAGSLAVRIARIARVEMPAAVRSQPVDRVEIERRRAEVLDRERDRTPSRRWRSDPA